MKPPTTKTRASVRLVKTSDGKKSLLSVRGKTSWTTTTAKNHMRNFLEAFPGEYAATLETFEA